MLYIFVDHIYKQVGMYVNKQFPNDNKALDFVFSDIWAILNVSIGHAYLICWDIPVIELFHLMCDQNVWISAK